MASSCLSRTLLHLFHKSHGAAGQTSDPHFVRSASVSPPPFAEKVISAVSGSAGLGQALEVQEVEFRRRFAKAGQDGVRLAAMMGLVVEPVVEGGHQRLNELVR